MDITPNLLLVSHDYGLTQITQMFIDICIIVNRHFCQTLKVFWSALFLSKW